MVLTLRGIMLLVTFCLEISRCAVYHFLTVNSNDNCWILLETAPFTCGPECHLILETSPREAECNAKHDTMQPFKCTESSFLFASSSSS